MEVDKTTQREHSSSINHNQQRFQSTESTKSNISKTFSIDYADRVQACSYQLWTNQLNKRA